MKRAIAGAFILGAVVMLTTAVLAEDGPWFDTKNCAFCKQLANQPGLLEHMNTEYHDIANGLVSFTHFDSAYLPAWDKAKQGMATVIKEMQTTGKPPYMCGHCAKYGEFMMAGVKIEEVNTAFGIINVYTAPDSTWIPKLHDFGKKSAEALAQYRKEHPETK